jgi:hypothetical protein
MPPGNSRGIAAVFEVMTIDKRNETILNLLLQDQCIKTADVPLGFRNIFNGELNPYFALKGET